MDWIEIYFLPGLVIFDSYSCCLQCKTLNNLYLNKELFTFLKLTSHLYSFCKLSDETVLHLFHECDIIQNLWNHPVLFFENEFALFDLTPQAAFVDFLNANSNLLLIQNHLLLMLKTYIYKSRKFELLILKSLIREIKIKNREKNCHKQWKRQNMYKEKWQQVDNIFQTKAIWLFTLPSSALDWVKTVSRKKELVFSNQNKVSGWSFFVLFCNKVYEIGFSVENNFKKKRNC